MGTIWPPGLNRVSRSAKICPPRGPPDCSFLRPLFRVQSRHAWIQAFNYRFLEISVIWLEPKWGQTNFELSIDTKFEKISQSYLTLLSNVKKWEIFSQFCGLVRTSELYEKIYKIFSKLIQQKIRKYLCTLGTEMFCLGSLFMK